MLDQARTRTLPLLNRTADIAPAPQACCGVCRTCATTNILALAGALVAGAAAFALRLRERPGQRRDVANNRPAETP